MKRPASPPPVAAVENGVPEKDTVANVTETEPQTAANDNDKQARNRGQSRERMRQMREREAAGRRIPKIVINSDRVRDALIKDRRISMASELNFEEQDRALERVIEDYCRRIERRDA